MSIRQVSGDGPQMFVFEEGAAAAIGSGIAPERPLAWVRVAPAAPYFVTDEGLSWTPIGHNDALPWPSLSPVLDCFTAVADHFRMLQAKGVTCLRLMLEYAQHEKYLLERRPGSFRPRMVERWDRLFSLAERYGIRFLLTPFDTFWMWKRWARHPYNAANGGPCDTQRRLLISAEARAAIKARFAFAIDRWSASGAVFAWDIWNEIHPAYGCDDVGCFDDYITDIAGFIRERERERLGRSHLITVSAFGPMLTDAFRSKELGHTSPDPRAVESIFRHPALDFATVHTYAHGTIDDPRNTVDPAAAMAVLTRASIQAIADRRPFLDSEHGPIHAFKDKRRILTEAFDDEYFRHLQWAHLASGGAGGGMRWPNRHPHVLTAGMHEAQRALAAFMPLIDWSRFDRRNINEELRVAPRALAAFGCRDGQQAVVWLVRRRPCKTAGGEAVQLDVPGLAAGRYRVTPFNTESGTPGEAFEAVARDDELRLEVLVERDLALAIRANG